MIACPDVAAARAKAEAKRAAIEKKYVVHEWSVMWCLHADPPDPWPRVLARELVRAPRESGAMRGDLAALYTRTLREVPKGFGMGWVRHDRPPRRHSQDQRAKQRRAAMERRIREHYPLFAESMIEEELAARHEYYAA